MLVNGLTQEEYLTKETSLQKGKFWAVEYEFTPYLCETIIGYGKQLIYLGTLNQRPYYWLIMIDSNTDLSLENFDYEDILQLIEEECGHFRYDDKDYNEDDCKYPMICCEDGIHWGMVVNFITGKEG